VGNFHFEINAGLLDYHYDERMEKLSHEFGSACFFHVLDGAGYFGCVLFLLFGIILVSKNLPVAATRVHTNRSSITNKNPPTILRDFIATCAS
jgi:hypothetical protein